MKRWFLPAEPDVMGLLSEQAEITQRGIDAFCAWAEGDVAMGTTVRTCEHEADEARRRLQRTLKIAFSTPVDPEDLYALSERLDAVLNGAKNAVREAEVLAVEPDLPVAAMATQVNQGCRALREAFAGLVTDTDHATEYADEAIRAARRLEHEYRAAMATLPDMELRRSIAMGELYRRCSHMADDLVGVAERVWYTVVKSG